MNHLQNINQHPDNHHHHHHNDPLLLLSMTKQRRRRRTTTTTTRVVLWMVVACCGTIALCYDNLRLAELVPHGGVWPHLYRRPNDADDHRLHSHNRLDVLVTTFWLNSSLMDSHNPRDSSVVAVATTTTTTLPAPNAFFSRRDEKDEGGGVVHVNSSQNDNRHRHHHHRNVYGGSFWSFWSSLTTTRTSRNQTRHSEDAAAPNQPDQAAATHDPQHATVTRHPPEAEAQPQPQPQSPGQEQGRRHQNHWPDASQPPPQPQPPPPPQRPVRVIYGIMSHDMTRAERQRRQLIRRTFLSFYKKQGQGGRKRTSNTTTVSDLQQKQQQQEQQQQRHWICSFNDWLHNRLEQPHLCRMAYAFVVGANPKGPTLLLEYNESFPMTTTTTTTNTNSTTNEPDVVYLNIRENGNDGKTPTWFRYASTTAVPSSSSSSSSSQQQSLQPQDWDYIFKADSDTILYTPWFFDFLDRHTVPTTTTTTTTNVTTNDNDNHHHEDNHNHYVYGGSKIGMQRCHPATDAGCHIPPGLLAVGTSIPYMQGGCYFVSTALARAMTNPQILSMDHITQFPHEDILTGWTIYQLQQQPQQQQQQKLQQEQLVQVRLILDDKFLRSPGQGLRRRPPPRPHPRRQKAYFRDHGLKSPGQFQHAWNVFLQSWMPSAAEQ